VIFDFSFARAFNQERKKEIYDWRLSIFLSLSIKRKICLCVQTDTYRRRVLHHHDDTKRKIGDILIVCNHRSLENHAPPTEF
jgi:hypothetical protein